MTIPLLLQHSTYAIHVFVPPKTHYHAKFGSITLENQSQTNT